MRERCVRLTPMRPRMARVCLTSFTNGKLDRGEGKKENEKEKLLEMFSHPKS